MTYSYDVKVVAPSECAAVPIQHTIDEVPPRDELWICQWLDKDPTPACWATVSGRLVVDRTKTSVVLGPDETKWNIDLDHKSGVYVMIPFNRLKYVNYDIVSTHRPPRVSISRNAIKMFLKESLHPFVKSTGKWYVKEAKIREMELSLKPPSADILSTIPMANTDPTAQSPPPKKALVQTTLDSFLKKKEASSPKANKQNNTVNKPVVMTKTISNKDKYKELAAANERDTAKLAQISDGK